MASAASAQPITDYRPQPSTVAWHNSTCEVKALCGPVGSGKSSAAGMEFLLLCVESDVPIRGLVVRESYRQLADSTRVTLMRWYGPLARYVKSAEQLELTVPNYRGQLITHTLDFRHCRRPEEVSNLLSTEYALIWLEEPVPAYQMEAGVIGAGLPAELFDAAQMRSRQDRVHRRHILLTFNPPSKFHWVYKTFFVPTVGELAAQDMMLVRQPAYENAANLPPGYYEKLADRLDPDLARRFVLGEPVTLYPGVRVYPQCFEDTHTVEYVPPVEGVPLVLMYDFGLTPVCLFTQVLPAGRLVVLRELQLWNAGVEQLAERMHETLKTYFPGMKVSRGWGDPAGAAQSQTDQKTCFEILAARGFPTLPGAVDFTARREGVVQRLQRHIDNQPALIIDRHGAPVLSEGMLGGYRYPRSRDGQVGSKPLKNAFSHACNALEYGCTGEFSITSGEAKAGRGRRRKPFDPLSDDGPARERGTWMGA